VNTPDSPGRRVLAAIEAALHTIWYDPTPGLFLRVVGTSLRPLSVLTGWVASQRRHQIDQRRHAPDPDTSTAHAAFVIIVGNLVAGGAGKTPICIALASALKGAGYSVGLMCRGGPASQHVAQLVKPDSTTGQFDPALGDEAVLLARATGLPVAIGWRRSMALRILCELPDPPQIVISDDGLQHVALRRDIELIVLDSRGLGNGRLLPAGPLREPATAAAGADAVILNTGWAHRPPPILPDIKKRFISRLTVRDLIPLTSYWAGEPEADSPASVPVSAFHGKRLGAVAAIANPAAFFEVLEGLGLSFSRYQPGDHASLDTAWLNSLNEEAIIITEKDAVKCEPADADKIFVLRIAAQPETGLLTWLAERLTASGIHPHGPTNS